MEKWYEWINVAVASTSLPAGTLFCDCTQWRRCGCFCVVSHITLSSNHFIYRALRDGAHSYTHFIGGQTHCDGLFLKGSFAGSNIHFTTRIPGIHTAQSTLLDCPLLDDVTTRGGQRSPTGNKAHNRQNMTREWRKYLTRVDENTRTGSTSQLNRLFSVDTLPLRDKYGLNVHLIWPKTLITYFVIYHKVFTFKLNRQYQEDGRNPNLQPSTWRCKSCFMQQL